LKAANLDKEWPESRALYVNGDDITSFFIKINYIDHLELTICQKKKTTVEEIEFEEKDKLNPDAKPKRMITRTYTYKCCNPFKVFETMC
jgi:hypothetical protein